VCNARVLPTTSPPCHRLYWRSLSPRLLVLTYVGQLAERYTASVPPKILFQQRKRFLYLQPFSQKSRTPTVAKVFQIGLCGVVEADWELFCNCWSAGFLGERL